MRFPTAEDYIRAVQHPELAFGSPELQDARFASHPLLGIPVPACGATATVFKATVDGVSQALRFFTRDDASTRQRYTALAAYLAERDLAGNVATCRWIDDAIAVHGQRWPMVQMEWVDGAPLDQHVEHLVDTNDTAALGTLAADWRDLLRRTQAAGFAHGDLQHGNVLVDRAGTLRMVDFDCSWIVPFAGSTPPAESGHRNYQRAARAWGPWMDTFPGLVIYVSLLVLSRDTTQWRQFYDGENLLFRGDDFEPPHRTRVWYGVAQLGDPHLDRLAGRLKACCVPGWSATSDLETLLAAAPPWWTQTRPPAGAGSPESPPGPAGPPDNARRPPPPATTGRATWWQQPPPPPAPATPSGGRKRTAVSVGVVVWLITFLLFAGVVRGAGGMGIGVVAGLVTAGIALGVLKNRARQQR